MEKQWLFKGCLFDLDGTLIDSQAAVTRSWAAVAQRHQLDVDAVLKRINGRPAGESLAELLAAEGAGVIEAECRWLQQQESTDTEGIVAIPGSVAFLQRLNQLGVPWAVVTSGSLSVASARMREAAIPTPPQLITCDDITRGKPDPQPYLLGADKLGVSAAECLVFEDAPSGVQSGLTAGSQVIGILSQYSADELYSIDSVIDYHPLQVNKVNGAFAMKIIG